MTTAMPPARAAEIPFAEQHRYGGTTTDAAGLISAICACGETFTGVGTLGAATREYHEHLTQAGRLTPAQARALTDAAARSDGWLDIGNVATRTEKILRARGLAEPVGPDYPDRLRITGAGLGTLAAHTRWTR